MEDLGTVTVNGVIIRSFLDSQNHLVTSMAFPDGRKVAWADTESKLGPDAVVSPSVMALVSEVVGNLLADKKLVRRAYDHLWGDSDA